MQNHLTADKTAGTVGRRIMQPVDASASRSKGKGRSPVAAARCKAGFGVRTQACLESAEAEVRADVWTAHHDETRNACHWGEVRIDQRAQDRSRQWPHA